MIKDTLLEVLNNGALSTAGTGLRLVGTAGIDTQVARNLGSSGKQLFLVVQIRTAVTSAGAATVAFVLASDAQAAIAIDGTATEHMRTPAIPKATLIAGYRVEIPIPPGVDRQYERYLGVLIDVGTAALTAGAADVFFTTDPPQWRALTSA